jgi:hypothetical protein
MLPSDLYYVTKSDIKMLKTAYHVTFSSGKKYDRDGSVILNIDSHKIAIFCESRSKTHGWQLDKMGDFITRLHISGVLDFKPREAWFIIMDADRDPIWQSALSILKPGDGVSIEIQANYHRPYVNELDDSGDRFGNINLDTVVLNIHRGEKRFSFIIKVKLSTIKEKKWRIIA